MRKICLSTLIALSSGCSSSGGSPAAIPADSPAALEAQWANENISDPMTLPTRGRATYAGFVTLGLPIGGTPRDHVGDLALTVDFGSAKNPFSGSVSNIDGVSGVLSIDGGNLYRGADPKTGYMFDSALTGTLVKDGNSYTVDGSLTGDFRGRFFEGVTGVVYGDLRGPDGQDLFDGTFVAARSN